jgi:hypothetical protein
MGYEMEGQLLEVCTCKILCPCWVGEDPDQEVCDSVNSWHVDQGTIDGVDVSGLTLATLNHIPGNALAGNWRMVVFIDDHASQAQHDALFAAFSGKLGGPLADLAKLYGTIEAVEKAAIVFDVKEGRGHLKVGEDLEAEMAPYQGATKRVTTLHDTAFSTIPGSPAYVSKAAYYRVKNALLGFDIDLRGHNAIQGKFQFKG